MYSKIELTENFLSAKSDQNLSAIQLRMDTESNFFFNLIIDEKSKYSDQVHTAIVEQPVNAYLSNGNYDTEITRISFHGHLWSDTDIYKTFLNELKKDSVFYFTINANTQQKTLKEANLVQHTVYATIEGKTPKRFLLFAFVGLDNYNNPITDKLIEKEVKELSE